ncbi:unnamed protein product [Cylindrotheca closterium]|uniref:Cytochrome P450 n=1 Tax=Cylindrotheca closterium TaxID=2856 RepID=A0AAD2FDW0_9STRA|nr:unnamed protein product [Cylindrotheca closterium]
MTASLLQTLATSSIKPNTAHVTLLSLAATAVTIYTVSSVLAFQKRRKLPDGVRLPPHLTSYVPYIGVGLQFVSRLIVDFIYDTAKKLDAPVFTATVNGTTCVFIEDPDLVFTPFKDSIQEIDSSSLRRQALVTLCGIDPVTAEEITNDEEVQKVVFADFHKLKADQLYKNMEAVQRVIGGRLEAMGLSETDGEWKSVRMFEFVREFIFFASVGPVISNGLMTQDQIIETYAKFEEGVPSLYAEAPSFITKENTDARERLVQMLMTPKVDEGLSEFMKARKPIYGHIPEVLARMNVGLIVATVSNSVPAVFWVLCQLLKTPKAFEACAKEVKHVADKKANKEDPFTLEELDKMPLLESCFKECLRMYQSAFIVRSVTGDFVLNPKESSGPKYLIEKGTRIMAYSATAHMHPSIFENPETFQYDRFLDPTKKALNGKRLLSYFRPFGGGMHLCPGRKFISYESRVFLAMLLLKLDMKLEDPSEPIPTIALHHQGFSVAHPNQDPKLLVKVKESKA